MQGTEGLASTDSDVSDAGTGDAASDGGARDGGDAGDAGAVVQVLVKSMTFEPADVTIHAGDTIHWLWKTGRHNIISGPVNGGAGVPDNKFCNPGSTTCATAPLQGPPYAWDYKFTQVGDYPYYCAPHVTMGMVGTIHVVP
jgi:plastocyanin